MEQILIIGLSQEMVIELTNRLSARVYAATTIGEATLLLRNLDFTSVILDLKCQAIGYRQLCDLMGEAPLTTRFFAFCDDPPEIDLDDLAEVGIRLLSRCGSEGTERLAAQIG